MREFSWGAFTCACRPELESAKHKALTVDLLILFKMRKQLPTAKALAQTNEPGAQRWTSESEGTQDAGVLDVAQGCADQEEYCANSETTKSS
jgi:hypothetical protein